MQLSLCVQLPKDMGGLSGSTCYITTSSKLPTTRLMQMTETNPRMPSHLCSLSNIHTMTASTIPILTHILSAVLPAFIEARSEDSTGMPVKLLVIDALAELFHLSDKTSTQTLVERSRHLMEISSYLHALASKNHIAILVINEVVDVFLNSPTPLNSHDGLLYRNQSRFFARATSVFGEDSKEPSLGLVWANQINARIFLTRTRRRRYINSPDGSAAKHQKTTGSNSSRPISPAIMDDGQPKLVRRLSVIFNSVSIPASVDYVIDISGLRTLPEAGIYIPKPSEGSVGQPQSVLPLPQSREQELDPLGGGNVEDGIVVDATDSIDGPGGEQHDEWDEYWKTDEIPEDVYHSIDIDGPTQGDPPLPSAS
jgi:DNA repair protein RAD57